MAALANVLDLGAVIRRAVVRGLVDLIVRHWNLEAIAERSQRLLAHFLLLVCNILPFAGLAHAVAFDGLGEDDRWLAFVLHGCGVGRVYFLSVVTTAVEPPDVVVTEVGDQVLQFLILAEEVLAGEGATPRLERLILTIDITQPGEVVLGPWTSAPPGLVTLNGALLSRTTYARLWSFAQTYGKLVSDATWLAGAYGAFSTGDGSTTFRIPTINGFFVRGAYDELGYTIGTYVPDSFASHNHGVNDPSHYHTYNQPVPTAAAALGSLNYTNVPSGTATGYAYTGISIQSAGSGSETKPRNIALRACMKY